MTRPIPIAKPDRPRIYCASSTTHAAMWREWTDALRPRIDIISTWHELDFPLEEQNAAVSAVHWKENIRQILFDADHLLVYATADDHIQGTLVEVGLAIGNGLPIHLIGTYPWRSWRHSAFIHVHSSLHAALVTITGAHSPIKAFRRPVDDPHS